MMVLITIISSRIRLSSCVLSAVILLIRSEGFWVKMHLDPGLAGSSFRVCVLLSLLRKRCEKDNITFHPNSTVSYREYRRYYFEPSMSAGNQSDMVTIPNMLVLVSLWSSWWTVRWSVCPDVGLLRRAPPS